MTESHNPYIALPYPYPGRYVEISKKEAKIGFKTLMEQKEQRIANFTTYLHATTGVHLSTSAAIEDLDRLPELLVSIGQRVPANKEFWQGLVDSAPEALKSVVREAAPKWEPDLQTLLLGFDAGLLWGEIFIAKYPLARWDIGRGGKTSVDFQQPVVIGIDPHHLEFNPIREIHLFIREVVSEATSRWTPTTISMMRAWSLGLDIDPREKTNARNPGSIK